MPKQLVDLTEEESKKVDDISKRWKMNKTDAIKRIIREFISDDLFNVEDLL